MAEKVYKNRVKEKYEKEVVPFLMKKFGYKSVIIYFYVHCFSPPDNYRTSGAREIIFM